MTVAEYAEHCRDNCDRPARSSTEDDPKFCGEIGFTEQGERQYAFCDGHFEALLHSVDPA